MMDVSNHHHLHLGVNKLGKAIKKEYTGAATATGNSSHSNTTFTAPPAPAPSQQPPVYHISKSDFRAFVQQLTGAGASCVPAPRPPTHPNPRPAAFNRLQQVRPPPLAPVARPAAAVPDPARPLPRRFPAESPVSAYMRSLESSLLHSEGSPGVPNVPSGSSQASHAVPSPATSPLGFPSPSSLLNLLSPGTLLHPPLSPGLFFPHSPSDFLVSPRWRDL